MYAQFSLPDRSHPLKFCLLKANLHGKCQPEKLRRELIFSSLDFTQDQEQIWLDLHYIVQVTQFFTSQVAQIRSAS